jgi:hypothetical protein
MKKLLLVGMVVVLTVPAWPTAALAGRDEWATAGKILTGVMAAQILLGCAPTVRHETVVVERPVYHEVRYYYPPVVRYETVYLVPPQHCAPPWRPHGHGWRHRPPPHAPMCPPHGARRLIQPPVPGHPPVIRQWSR